MHIPCKTDSVEGEQYLTFDIGNAKIQKRFKIAIFEVP